MHTFTALFDRIEDAEAAQKRLTDLGIMDLDHNKVYGQDAKGFERDAYSTQQRPGLWANAKGGFPPDEDRRLHEEHLRRGGYLLLVNADDAKADQVHQVLENSNAIDVEDRAAQYRASGSPAPASRRAELQGEELIPVVQERLKVGKRQVARGGLRVRAYVVEEPVTERVDLREEHVGVERRPVNQPVSNASGLFQDRTIEMTERAEEAVIAKDAHVVEEVVVHKDVQERTETVKDTIRRTEVDVQRTGGAGAARPSPK